MKKQIYIIAAMISAAYLSSCSKNSDDITIDAEKIVPVVEDVKNEIVTYNQIVYTIENNKMIVPIDQPRNAGVKVMGDYKVSYQSDNPEIASVDDKGLITAIAEGETDITVTIGEKTTAKIHVICGNILDNNQ